MDSLKGRVALVTGASEGIGAEICKKLVMKGMSVLGCARRKEAIEKLSAELKKAGVDGELVAFKCDMSKEEDIIAMYRDIRKKYEQIDVCINNAACISNSSLADGDSKNWREMIEVNVLGVCINTREALKMMKESCGQIINMGGITGHKIPNLAGKPHTPNAGLNFYHGTKFMIRALTEGLRQELKDKKIRVSAISPGSVETELLKKASTEQEAKVYFSTYECLKPEDIAAAVLYILSTKDYVNIHDIIMEPRAFLV